MRAPLVSYVVAWRRGPLPGSERDDPAGITLPDWHLRGVAAARRCRTCPCAWRGALGFS
jgi:hypothetical protein